MRDYIISIHIKSKYGDNYTLKREKNPHTGIEEPRHRSGWIKMLKGHILDVEKELEFLEKETTKK